MNEMGPPPAQADQEPPTPTGETLTPDGESACLVAATVAGKRVEEPEAFLGVDHRPADTTERSLGDFTTRPAILRLVPLAIVLGGLGAGISLALLDMIGFFTNLFYYQRLSVHLVSPAANTLGALAIVIPIGGGLVVGLMARFGSEQIRGHGIPEAMERILINGSRVQPRLAVLKPISSAVSIGTGGPFGAEGPIILTGGAVGSIVGQLFRLTAAERRALLVAGAAAGMSAVFGTPVAATLFGVELLAFEFRPRSMVLIGLAAATADGLRMTMANAGLVASQPIFPVPDHAPLGGVVLLGAAVVGIATGLGAWVMTQAVYRFEDLFKKLTGHLHWMWWPMIGGLLIGIGGLIDPRTLGVGYDTIHAELLGQLAVGALALLLVVKLVIWSGALGGGTSGGILAPIMMMGAAIGGILGHVLPGTTPGVWALLGLAGAIAGVTRSPVHRHRLRLRAHPRPEQPARPAGSSHRRPPGQRAGVTTIHPDRKSGPTRLPRHARVRRRPPRSHLRPRSHGHRHLHPRTRTHPGRHLSVATRRITPTTAAALPRLDADAGLVGVVPWSTVLASRDQPATPVRDAMITSLTVAHPDEILRAVADRMAALGLGVLPVVDRAALTPRRPHHQLRPPPSPPQTPRRRTTRRARPDTQTRGRQPQQPPRPTHRRAVPNGGSE